MKKYSISFVMPMYNEADNIVRTISSLIEVGDQISSDFEIIVVDDASNDGCRELAVKISESEPRVRVFGMLKNTKFGGAFAECFLRAAKDIIVYMDSDMPVSIEDIRESIPYIEDSGIVTGVSKIKKGETFFRKVVSLIYNLIVGLMFRLNIKDINSGYKVVRRELVKDIKFISKSPFIDVELFLRARNRSAKVTQYPLVFHPRQGGKSCIARLPIIIATFRDMLKVWSRKVVLKKD